MPSITELENFLIYGRVKNFSLAADEANVTQSAFSFQMKKLEKTIGVQLIERSNRGSHLTPEGEFFYRKLNEILPNLRAMIYDMQQITGKKPLELKVGVLTSLGDVLMNQHAAYFHQKYSNIFITVYSMEKDTLIQSLKHENIDIASTFLSSNMEIGAYNQAFFRTDRIVYYAPKLSISGKKIAAQTIFQFPFVKYPAHYLMSTITEDYLTNHIHAKPQATVQLSTPYAIINYCKENHAGAMLPERLLTALHENHRPNTQYYIDPVFDLKTYLLYKKENPKYHVMKVFIDYVIKLNKAFRMDETCCSNG
ncbi:LysR family transcriptional regulator [Sporolactobacillus sp. THM7-7]|nr:LysR family transcriptional regulator [Sporolactobacillus sp. THM7-7]